MLKLLPVGFPGSKVDAVARADAVHRSSERAPSKPSKPVPSTRKLRSKAVAEPKEGVGSAMQQIARQPGAEPPANLAASDQGANILVIVQPDAESPLGPPSPTWQEVFKHQGVRLGWANPKFHLSMATPASSSPSTADVQVGLVVGLREPEAVSAAAQAMQAVPTVLFLDCGPESRKQTRLGGIPVLSKDAFTQAIAKLVPWSKGKKDLELLQTLEDYWGRYESDDIYYMLITLINKFVTRVPELQSMQAGDLSTVQNMVNKCGPQIWALIKDPQSRKAIACLTKCADNDQVCSYRCLASYENPILQDFSLCILQKNNCLGLNAEIPMVPEVRPMASFRGASLSYDAADEIFIGWLGEKEWSWRVVAGQNAAYDQFPCQYQIFYHARNKNTMWYDPVFKVRTLEGAEVWRRRHYRVKRGKVPGTFHFTVLDNGVTSNEFWRIADCADDMSWALFYYAGAASVVGLTYRGAVLVTPEGEWPIESEQQRLQASLDACGIKMWELFRVDNDCSICQGAPLGLMGDAGTQSITKVSEAARPKQGL